MENDYPKKIITEFNENMPIKIIKIYLRDRTHYQDIDLFFNGHLIKNDNIPLYYFFRIKSEKNIHFTAKRARNKGKNIVKYNSNKKDYLNNIKLYEEEIVTVKEKNKHLLNKVNQFKDHIKQNSENDCKNLEKYNSFENIVRKQKSEINLLKKQIKEANEKYSNLKTKSLEKFRNQHKLTESNNNFAILSKNKKLKKLYTVQSFYTKYLNSNINKIDENKIINLENIEIIKNNRTKSNENEKKFDLSIIDINDKNKNKKNKLIANNFSQSESIFSGNTSSNIENTTNDNPRKDSSTLSNKNQNEKSISSNIYINKNKTNNLNKLKNSSTKINNSIEKDKLDKINECDNKKEEKLNISKDKKMSQNIEVIYGEPNKKILSKSKNSLKGKKIIEHSSRVFTAKYNYRFWKEKMEINLEKEDDIDFDLLLFLFNRKYKDNQTKQDNGIKAKLKNYDSYKSIFNYLDYSDIFSFSLTNKSTGFFGLYYLVNYFQNLIIYLNLYYTKLVSKYNEIAERIKKYESKTEIILSYLSKSGLRVLNGSHNLNIFNNQPEYFTKDNFIIFIFKILFLFKKKYQVNDNISDKNFIKLCLNDIKDSTKENKSLKDYIYTMLDKELDFSFENIIQAKSIMNEYNIKTIESNNLSKMERQIAIFGNIAKDLMGFSGLVIKPLTGVKVGKGYNRNTGEDVICSNLKNKIIETCKIIKNENGKYEIVVKKIKEILKQYYYIIL